MKSLVWLRRDLRVHDHPALAEALRLTPNVEAVYLLPDDPEHPLSAVGAARCYLKASLRRLRRALALRGVRLTLLDGDEEALLAWCHRRQARRVHWHRLVDPRQAMRDSALARALARAGIEVRCHEDDCLVPPERARNAHGEPYSAFGPFCRRMRAAIDEEVLATRLVSAIPARAARPVDTPPHLFLDAPLEAWERRILRRWPAGEVAACRQLQQFVQTRLATYEVDRDRFSDPGSTSRLSPALHFGELSIARVWMSCVHVARGMTDARGRLSAKRFLEELCWREFARHQFYARPQMAARSVDPRFDAATLWEEGEADTRLAAWQQGRTGVSLVDAGMRELWQTGWLHNRMRMVVASFLVKHLGVRWQHGASWFLTTLVDADVASNALNWQWVTGCGRPAMPYYRVFNPERQAALFDPDGRYRRRWLPADAVTPPLVDLAAARGAALERYRATVAGRVGAVEGVTA